MTKPKTIEIVSYDGRYPNLCFGRLKLKVDGKEYVTSPGVLCPGEGAEWLLRRELGRGS